MLVRPTTQKLNSVAALGLEGTSATAALDGVRVLEGEPLLFEAFVPINGGSIEVQGTLFINDDGDAVMLVTSIGFLVVAVVKIQCVAESAAATCRDADPQYHVFTEIVFGLKPLDFFCGSFGQFDCHRSIQPFVLDEFGEMYVR